MLRLASICNIIEMYQLTNASDLKVRDQFTGLIAKFAHFNVDNVPKKDGLFSVFTTDSGSPYIKIGDELTLEKNFRYIYTKNMLNK